MSQGLAYWFCACAITFQTQSTGVGFVGSTSVVQLPLSLLWPTLLLWHSQ